MGVDGIINSFNQFNQTMGTVQGAAEGMMPAVYSVNNAVNQVASVFTGDTYQPATYPPVQAGPSLLGGPKAGLVGSLLAGGTVGAITHQQTADALRSFRTDGFGTGLKNLGKVSLKSGLMGAGIMGAVSGIKNFAAASRGEISNAQAKGNVAADTIGGILAGTSGGLAAGAASLALKAMMPGGGLLTTLGTAVAGAVGATGANFLYENSVRDSIANSIGGTNTTQTAYYTAPQQNYYGY